MLGERFKQVRLQAASDTPDLPINFVVGGIATCVDVGLFMLFAQGLGLPYLRVAACTFVVATAAGGFGIALYALGWLVIPAGEGFSYMWPEGREKVFIPWHEASVFVPPASTSPPGGPM